MIDLPTAEKIKHPALALIAGLLIGLTFGAGGAWTASTIINDAQFKVLAAVNDDLRRQVEELTTSSQAKEVEMGKLREKISALSPQRREAESKRRTELEKFIQRVDKEIDNQKIRLSRPIWLERKCDSGGGNCRTINSEDRPMSDLEKRLERELDTLIAQRHEARKKLIELLAQ
jgi:predicted site-specific integrase-resolvase